MRGPGGPGGMGGPGRGRGGPMGIPPGRMWCARGRDGFHPGVGQGGKNNR